MPVIEFFCSACDKTSDYIIPMREVTADLTAGCKVCGAVVPRILYSRPLAPLLLGDPAGYYRPSPTKRFSTKLAHVSGNKDSAG